jgi:hypothetical protein
MAGKKIVLPTTFSDNGLPILRDDPILSSGSLMLLDAAHTASPWAAGVPAHNALLPNLASDSAMAILGTADANAVKPKFIYTTAFNAARGKVERSVKGGLHYLVSAGVWPANTNEGAKFDLPLAMRQRLLANLDNDYFVSMWARVTRPQGVNGAEVVPHYMQISNTTSSTGQYLAAFSHQTLPNTTARIGYRETNSNALGPMLRNIGVSVFTSGKPTLAIDADAQAGNLRANFGVAGKPLNSANASVTNNALPSYVLYRYYVEDLTVSGRSYSDVDAIDSAEYTKQVLTAGGRYYNDTVPTDPATLP